MMNDTPTHTDDTQAIREADTDAVAIRLAATAVATAALSACGGGGGGSSTGATVSLTPLAYRYAAPTSDAEAARFLLQVQFSASDAEMAAVRSQGYAGWLSDQLAQPISMTGWDWLNSRGYDAADNNTFFDQTYPANYMVWQQLMTWADAVRKRVALALSEFYVVSMGLVDVTWRSHAMGQYWDTLNANAFGSYRQLLEDITLNPAMGYFLNTKGNLKENSSGRQPDENYAREVMQLFTIGLYELNPDGTEKLNGSGQKIESYTQSDVSNLARVFTGYDYDTSQSPNTTITLTGGTRNLPANPMLVKLPMSFNAANHSTLAATFLGTTIAANTEGKAALKTALDTLANHPNAGPFFAKQMIQKLVTSNPSSAYVARVASVFNDNGHGVRGDLKSVFAAIWLDDEARNPSAPAGASWGKLREPMVRFVQWGRSFGLSSIQGSWKVPDMSDSATRLGQNPLTAPSVFNFFRPGYVPPSSVIAQQGKVAPEFQLVNESTVAGYLNFMRTVIRSGMSVQSPDLPNNTGSAVLDMQAAYTAELAVVANTDALLARLNLILCAGQLGAASQSIIRTALNTTLATNTGPSATASTRLDQVACAVLMVMACSEYLVQK